MPTTLSEILADDYLGDLQALDIAEVRRRRTSCKHVETGLSYLRRLAQGRLDVVEAEMRRRAEGGDPDDLAALIARLPVVLADKTQSSGMGHGPVSLDTGHIDPGLSGELEGIAGAGQISDATSIDDSELAAVKDRLVEFEAKVSGLRRTLFDRVDTLEAELTRRYRTGEASVDSLLDSDR